MLNALFSVLAVAALVLQPAASMPDAIPWRDQPFLGLVIRDAAYGPVVAWVRPGPLGGAGLDSTSGIRRDDNLIAINDQPITSAAAFDSFLAAAKPGHKLRLTFRRDPAADPNAAIPKGGPGGDPIIIETTIADRDSWSGTIGRGWKSELNPAPPAGPGEFEAQLLALHRELLPKPAEPALGGDLTDLLPYLQTIQRDALDPNSLSWVVHCFEAPLRIDRIEADLAALVRTTAQNPSPDSITMLLHRALDIEPMREVPADRERAMLDKLHIARDEWVEVTTAQPAARQLMRTMRDSMSPSGAHAESDIRVIRRAGETAADLLRWHLDRLPWSWPQVTTQLSPHASDKPRTDLPAHLRAAVTGDILFWEERGGGAINVVGGPGPNTYDMSVINWVYDSGGDDTYRYPQPKSDALINERIIIDLAGNDTYEGDGDFGGPGVGAFACGIVDDRAGNDTYSTSGQCALASGLFGIGIILDHAGNDTYANRGPRSGWSLGAGFYGAGLILDLDGKDEYIGEKLVQGVGGPRGFGAIIELRGEDSYTANGPSFPSAYGTPNVFLAMSQGFGFGIRGYASGGVGAIYDLAGDDRYQGGEFAQAGGYYFGLGILHDFSGRDSYSGSRYNQGFSAHQAVGILIDDAGEDAYAGYTAASQAGAWDQSIGWLIDRAGNDTYKCDGLGQGAASMQALAVFIDLAGDDRYTAAATTSVQGESGSNTYHFAKDRILSFSALLDLGGGRDTYTAPDRADGRKRATGAQNSTSPADSTLWGILVDDGPRAPP